MYHSVLPLCPFINSDYFADYGLENRLNSPKCNNIFSRVTAAKRRSNTLSMSVCNISSACIKNKRVTERKSEKASFLLAGDASRSRSQNENFRRMVPTPAVFNNGFQETHRLAATHASFRFPASHQFRKMAKNHDARKYLAALSPSGSRANASTFSSHEDFRARGSYFLNARGSGEEVFPAHYEQRTWTAAPRLDLLDPDTTTRDPAIPENPEGLKNPSLLVGLWEEEPTIRETDAYFK